MKNLTKILTVLAVLLILPAGLTAQGQHDTAGKIIAVSGTGQIKGNPDVAVIEVGVNSFDAEIRNAFQMNNEKMENLIEVFRNLGVKSDNLQTTNFNIYYDEGYIDSINPANSREKGYRVNNTLSVRIENLEILDTALETALNNGADQMWGVKFDVKDPAALLRDAREKALANAREKAEHLASLEGMEVTGIRSISEPEAVNIREGMNFRMAAPSAAGAIAPGVLNFTAALTVVFEVR